MEVIDNFLTKHEFDNLTQIITGNEFAWYYNDFISHENKLDDEFYFTHIFFNSAGIRSHFYNALTPILNKLNIKKLLRIKANLYPRTETIVHHENHVDQEYKHNGLIFYINTNDGFTVIGNNNIESIANRALFFDPSELHHSTTCTNNKCRINININYINKGFENMGISWNDGA